MIRRLITVQQRLVASTSFQVLLGSALIGLGMSTLQKLVEARAGQLDALDEQIKARRAELAALEAPLSPAPAGTYPAREDLTPLASEDPE